MEVEEHALLITEIRQIGCMVDFWKQKHMQFQPIAETRLVVCVIAENI